MSEKFKDKNSEICIYEKAKALDSYIYAQVGEVWLKLKNKLRLSTDNTKISKEMWRFFLVAIYLTKSISVNKKNKVIEIIEKILESDEIYESNIITSSSSTISLVCTSDNRFIKSDLQSAWHPSFEKNNVVPLQKDELEEGVVGKIKKTLDFLETTSVFAADLLKEVCASVCILSDEGLQEGACVSLTSKIVPGLIYMSTPPVIMMAETMVHESSHLWLSRHESSCDLYSDSNKLLMTPLRPDPRPISGLLHQVWVLSNLIKLYQDFEKSNESIIKKNAPKITKRLNIHKKDYSQGLSVIRENMNSFTENGVAFIRRFDQ
jgi:hypothetical protein